MLKFSKFVKVQLEIGRSSDAGANQKSGSPRSKDVRIDQLESIRGESMNFESIDSNRYESNRRRSNPCTSNPGRSTRCSFRVEKYFESMSYA